MAELKQLVKAFHQAALFLLDRIKHDGWTWSSNYLREHVRCSTGLTFTNSDSPRILRELRKAHPEIAQHIPIKPLKKG